MKSIRTRPILALLCMAIICLCPAFVRADTSGKCGDNLYWSFNSSTSTLTINGSGAMYDFGSSSQPWSSVRDQIISVSFPDGLTYLGRDAFYRCASLTSVSLPNGLKTIGEYAFEYCTALTSVSFSNGIISIGNYAFYHCEALASVSIPSSVITIGQYAFYGCKNLQTVSLRDGLKTIGKSAFMDCEWLGSITIPNTVTSIGSYAFSGCDSISSIVIPDGITLIDDYVFSSCDKLKTVTIPHSVTRIGDRAFSTCFNLTDVFYYGTFEDRKEISIIGDDPATGSNRCLTFHASWHYLPVITLQPNSVSATVGSQATFKVETTNAISYQWQYQIPGNSTWYDAQNNGMSAIFNQTNVELRHDGFLFRCKVSNVDGIVYSNTAKLTVSYTPPTITNQPTSASVAIGTTATYQVTASNATSYQWQYQRPNETTWNDVQSNGKSATFNQTNVEKRHDGFLFRCKVSNGGETVYSNSAKLTVITTPPTITSQPTSVTMDVGKTAMFKVVATNGTSYQWQYQKPGNSTWYDVQNNGKSATFNQTNLEKRHNGFLFRCKVTNAIGSVYSNTAKMTVPTTAPTITGQPASVTKDLAATATFKVTATGATGYQWEYQKPGNSTWYVVQDNGKSATFNQTNVAARHNGFLFRCKVSNGVGSVYSSTAKLTVPTTAPTITGQPASVTVNLGATATFKVTATGATGYQWQYQIPGSSTWNDVKNDGKSATFNQTNCEKRHNGYLFRCKVTNGVGSTYSNTAKLTVPTTAPTISGQPASVTKDLGATATFKVVASNATSYQWQYQIPGSSTWNDVQNNGKAATFNQTNVEKRHNGYLFRCKVTNSIGSVFSNSAKLTVATTAPTISGQPSNVTATLGSTAMFKVTSANATSYQWQYQKPGDSTWYDVQNNGKSATFNQTNVAQRHNGFLFRCKVTNALGSTYSNTAKLTLN